MQTGSGKATRLWEYTPAEPIKAFTKLSPQRDSPEYNLHISKQRQCFLRRR